MVTITKLTRLFCGYPGKHSTCGIARYQVGTNIALKMVSMVQYPGLDSVPVLPIGTDRFPSNCITDPGGSHQVTLIARIDKLICHVDISIQCPDRDNGTIFHAYPRFSVQICFPVQRNLIFIHKLIKYQFGSMGFKDPHGSVLAVDGNISLPFIPILIFLLPSPGRVLLVMEVKTMVKIAGKPPDYRFISRIGPSQPR